MAENRKRRPIAQKAICFYFLALGLILGWTYLRVPIAGLPAEAEANRFWSQLMPFDYALGLTRAVLAVFAAGTLFVSSARATLLFACLLLTSVIGVISESVRSGWLGAHIWDPYLGVFAALLGWWYSRRLLGVTYEAAV